MTTRSADLRLQKFMDLLDYCRPAPWMNRRLARRLLTLMKRVCERCDHITTHFGKIVSMPLNTVMVVNKYRTLAFSVPLILGTPRLEFGRRTSRTSRPYMGFIPKPFTYSSTGGVKRAWSPSFYSAAIVTHDLSKLGKRRMYSRVRTKVWEVVREAEGKERGLWERIAPILKEVGGDDEG